MAANQTNPRDQKRLTRAWVVAFLVTVCTATSLPVSAVAHPHVGKFGPAIDPPAGYVPQTTCQPAPKLGVVSFMHMLERAYPVSGSLGISRACNVGSTSEHKEGRAFDWAVRYSVPRQRRAAKSALSWLLDKDRYGNKFALARRFGIMYLIWHRRIWEPWAGWKTYCVQRGSSCVSPTSGAVLNPHVSHVHFSFTWPGARKRVTAYHHPSTFVSSISGTPWGGYWMAGRNGQVMPYNAYWYGAMSSKVPSSPVVSLESTPDGGGYWLITGDGAVKAYGNAVYRGSRRRDPIHAGGFESTPNGRGYWLYAKSGRVFAYGQANQHGGLASAGNRDVTAMMSTPTGRGYWLVTSNGRVVPFGDATHHGWASSVHSPVVGADNHFADGYWLVTRSGHVRAFGGARNYGDTTGKNVHSPVVSLTATDDGNGYWLATAKGRVMAFGSASNYGYPGHTMATPVMHYGACNASCSGSKAASDLRD